nr:putative receptor-like protein kinase At4g00960 [Ipomoea trifida]
MILLAIAQPELIYSICGQTGNYTQNSVYQSNLNTVLLSLSSNLNQYGFSNVSMGENPDRVSAVALCRGDVEADICHSCVEDARRKIVQSCPNQKAAFGVYYECLINYSNVSTLGSWSRLPGIFVWNRQNSSSPDQFNQDLRKLLDSLRDRAANGFPLRKFAEGNTSGPDFQTIYAAVQCSPDLSAQSCSDCLVSAFADLPDCACFGKNGGSVVRPSCNFRFDTTRFFNYTLSGPPPSPAPVVDEISTVDDISTVESLQYNFGTIRHATNNFSDSNKLGQGGFGHVYKAWTQWQEGTALNLVDPILRGNSGSSVSEIVRCIHMALLCVQENVGVRPTMSAILHMLSGSSLSLPLPSAPAFFMHTTINPEAPLLLNETAAAYSSQNEASITELYPR